MNVGKPIEIKKRFFIFLMILAIGKAFLRLCSLNFKIILVDIIIIQIALLKTLNQGVIQLDDWIKVWLHGWLYQ